MYIHTHPHTEHIISISLRKWLTQTLVTSANCHRGGNQMITFYATKEIESHACVVKTAWLKCLR